MLIGLFCTADSEFIPVSLGFLIFTKAINYMLAAARVVGKPETTATRLKHDALGDPSIYLLTSHGDENPKARTTRQEDMDTDTIATSTRNYKHWDWVQISLCARNGDSKSSGDRPQALAAA